MFRRFIKNEVLEQVIVECGAIEFSLHTIIDCDEMDSFYYESIKNNVYKNIKQLHDLKDLNIIEKIYRNHYKSKLQTVFLNAHKEYELYKREELDKCFNNLNKDN